MTAQSIRVSGIDFSHFDLSVRPQADLYGYANGAWLRTCEIPADRVHSGSVSALRDRAELDVQTIIMAAVSTPAAVGTEVRQIADLYSSFMDLDAVAAAGPHPIAAELAAITGACDRGELAVLLGRLQRTGIRCPAGRCAVPGTRRARAHLGRAARW